MECCSNASARSENDRDGASIQIRLVKYDCGEVARFPLIQKITKQSSLNGTVRKRKDIFEITIERETFIFFKASPLKKLLIFILLYNNLSER